MTVACAAFSPGVKLKGIIMSINAVIWASKQRLSSNDKLVLWALCDHLNENTKACYPSTNRIADFTGLSKRTVLRCIQNLQVGYITVNKDKGITNNYTINFDYKLPEVVTDSHQCHTVTSDRESLPSDTQSLPPVTESHQTSDTQSPKPRSNQEYKPGIKPDCAKAHVDDLNSLEIEHGEYYDKPPFSPDDISTKALEHRFDEFWSNYPVKKSKADAHKKWMKIKPDQNLLDTMIKALQDQTEEKAAQKKLEGFAPNWKNPSTWLNQKCWEDEIYIPEQPKQRKSALENYYDDKPKKIHPSMEGLGDEIGRRPGETPTQYWHRLERAKAKLRESRAEGYSVPMGSNDKDTRGFLDRPNGFN